MFNTAGKWAEILGLNVISLSLVFSLPHRLGSPFPSPFSGSMKGTLGGKIPKMMLKEERNAAALEKIKPRQLVLPAHVPLAPNPFIATAKKKKKAKGLRQKSLLRSSVAQGQELLHWQAAGLGLSQNYHPGSLMSLPLRAQRNAEFRGHAAKKAFPRFMSAHLKLWAWHWSQIPAQITSGNQRIHPLA